MAGRNSPLRYPGGKAQLTEFVNNIIKKNEITDTIYCEPFCGGSGVAINLLLNNKVKKIVLNDYDTGIYSIWKAIKDENDDLVDKINNTNININEWYKQKSIYQEEIKKNRYTLELAFATFFLNRTNRSGIIDAGPIGGYNQNSKYKIDCRFNKKDLVEKIKNIGNFSSRISIYNLDAEELVERTLLKADRRNLFIFFDPPYYNKSRNLYTNFFNHDKHESLKNAISKLNNYYWITTYDTAEEIKDIYEEYSSKKYQIAYSAGKKRKEKEYIFYSDVTFIEEYHNIKFFN